MEVAAMAGLPRRPVTTGAAALIGCTAMLAALAALPTGPAWARPARAGTAAAPAGTRHSGAGAGAAGRAARPHAATAGTPAAGAPPGTNLLLNPGAQTGAASGRGWDSVTIPGWQVVSGLPTVVRYDTPRYPQATGRWPLVPGGQLFAGGAGGTARLRLLRTIEAALGLGTLTPNDRYAAPVNDVFARQPAPPAPATAPRAARPAQAPAPGRAAATPAPPPRRPERHPPGRRRGQPTAFAVNSASATVTPVGLATHRAGAAIKVGRDPRALAITPGGRTAYVTNSGSGTVTPIDTATGHAGTPIRTGRDPRALAIAPGGRTAYVLDWGGAAVTPIDTATGTGRAAHRGGQLPVRGGLRPGRPYRLRRRLRRRHGHAGQRGHRAGRPRHPGRPGTGRPRRHPGRPHGLRRGRDSDAVIPIGAGTGRAHRAIGVGYSPAAIAISGTTAFVVNTISGTVTPVSTRTGRAGPPIPAGVYNYPTAITLAPSGGTAVVVGTYAGKVTLIDTHTRRAIAQVKVGSYPVAAAVAG
jgi:YVTN family beta-propeller protein